MHRFTFIFISFLIFSSSFAQDRSIEQCGHVAYMDYLESQDPGIKQSIQKAHEYALQLNSIKTKAEEADTVYTIQVVFHVVYNNNVENLSNELIESQLNVLNNTYRRQNADTIKTRPVFQPVAKDTRIQFVFASEDPDGNPTNGIVRVPTSKTSFLGANFDLSEADEVKQATFGSQAWDTEKYLNIWVCDLNFQGYDLLFGYAYPPTGAPNWGSNSFATSDRQGVVLHYKIVGENNPLNPSSASTGVKTAVHEVGHYLGLRHIWGDAPGNGSCNTFYDDGLEDTPLSGNASQGCNPTKNTCNNETPNLPDQIENYMDYSSETCQNMFTHDQAALMRNNIRTYRSDIVVEKEYPEPVYENTQVFPNPAFAEITITIGNVDATKQYAIRFTNMLGQVVLERNLQSLNIQKIEVDLGMRGPYYYEVVVDDSKVILEDKMVFIN